MQSTVDTIPKNPLNDVPSQRITEKSLPKGFHNPKSLVKGNPKSYSSVRFSRWSSISQLLQMLWSWFFQNRKFIEFSLNHMHRFSILFLIAEQSSSKEGRVSWRFVFLLIIPLPVLEENSKMSKNNQQLRNNYWHIVWGEFEIDWHDLLLANFEYWKMSIDETYMISDFRPIGNVNQHTEMEIFPVARLTLIRSIEHTSTSHLSFDWQPSSMTYWHDLTVILMSD